MKSLDTATENALRYFADIPTQKPSDWCVENLRFDEDDNHGPFSFAGSEYCREIVDDFGDTSVNDSVAVFGSQTRKTGSLMGGVAWCVENDPCGFLWAMPSVTLAQTFSRKRWMPMLRASRGTSHLIPTGAERHDFKTLDQKLGASSIMFTGSNSAANLSSTPRRRVIGDEVDKFDTGGRKEGSSLDLLGQRTKGQPNAQRFKTSTPTLVEGLIWQEMLKGDMRRYYVPCPLCGRHHPSSRRIVLAWSKEYTVLPKTGLEAYVEWDKGARLSDGQWDLDRVERSAHFKCPHCAGEILDASKTWMVREGIWQATKKASAGFVSRQLPSLYACSMETTVGKLAKKFLEQKNSLLGLQGFINGDLAEPYQSQDTMKQRTELVSSKVEITAEWRKLLTVDCQAKAPYFWHVVRAWDGGNSEGVAAGPLDQWSDIEAVQSAHGIENVHVGVDSGFGAKSDAEVYKECSMEPRSRVESAIIKGTEQAVMVGWRPMKGMPGRKRWRDEDTGAMLPYNLGKIDPFSGTAYGGQVMSYVLQFSGDFFKDILQALREGKGGFKWSVCAEMATEEYWRHMDSQIKKPLLNKRTGFTSHEWQARSKHWPDHIFDCEVEQIAKAVFHKFFNLPTQ